MSEARDPDKLKQKLLAFAQDFPFFKLIGFSVLDCGPLWSKCQLQLRSELMNPNGVVHGGVLATLIDAGITQAMLMTDEYQVVRDTKGLLTTIDLRVKYLRPAAGSGVLLCESTIPHLGKRVVHAQSTVKDEAGKNIALGDATLMIAPGKATS
ncbi:MAG TPA: PaaI family thioesterase [Polyangiales bacterium]